MDQVILDRASAEEIYEITCNQSLTAEAIGTAFINVISRKLKKPNAPAMCNAEDTDYFARIERMFDKIFDVEAEIMSIQGIIDQCAKASVHLLEKATKATMDNEPDMAEMYGEDLKDYMLIRAYFTEGKTVEAYQKWQSLDTASRDNLYVGLDEKGESSLSKALNRIDWEAREEKINK